MLPVSIIPALKLGAFIVFGAFLVWLWDEIGDRREIKVHARYAAAAEATNIDVRAFNSEDDRVSAIAEALREQALVKSKAVPRKLIVNKEQANALTEIKWP